MSRETKRPQEPETQQDLPALTPKQHNFVKGILAGKTLSDAYRQSYDCQNQPAEQIWRDASLQSRNPKVIQWLKAARQQNLSSCKVTLESHIAELERLSGLAEQAGAFGAAIKAQELRGKVSDLYVDRIRNENTATDLVSALQALPEHLATQLADHYGVKWPPDDDESETQVLN